MTRCKIIKLELQSGNAQIGSQSLIFSPLWPWNLNLNLKSNKVALLCYFKLFAPFHNHLWNQTGVTVLKHPISHRLNCRPGPCEGVAGAMSASRVVCKVVQFTVKQRQLHASPPANELNWLLEPKLLATPAISSSQSRVEVYIYIKATQVRGLNTTGAM